MDFLPGATVETLLPINRVTEHIKHGCEANVFQGTVEQAKVFQVAVTFIYLGRCGEIPK